MVDIEDSATIIQSASIKAKEQADLALGEATKAKNSVEGFTDKIRIANESIDKIHKDLEPLPKGLEEVKAAVKKIPYIDLLVFQNAVAKLSSTDALKLFIGIERTKWISAYLENVILAINSFDEQGHILKVILI
ncbi:MAG: hypothetical protein IPP27_01530 [Bacteroidetes bacterium]|nr:hypothetical protein [Bacteroidota bacterium]